MSALDHLMFTVTNRHGFFLFLCGGRGGGGGGGIGVFTCRSLLITVVLRGLPLRSAEVARRRHATSIAPTRVASSSSEAAGDVSESDLTPPSLSVFSPICICHRHTMSGLRERERGGRRKRGKGRQIRFYKTNMTQRVL